MRATQTPGTKFLGGVPVFIPNSVYEGKNFYISHNDRDWHIYGGETTALVYEDSQRTEFYILNGDHRKQYAELIPQGYDVCKAYYDSLPNQHNAMSDTPDSLEKLRRLLYGE